LRINVDARNVDQVWPLLDLFAERGWLGPETRFFPYLARVSPFTDACAGSAATVCRLDDFHAVQFRWMERLEHFGVPIIEQGLYQFPEPKLYSCGAVGANGFVFTPDGEIHKCGLEVDDSRRAIIVSQSIHLLPIRRVANATSCRPVLGAAHAISSIGVTYS
jgi:uncharacterized protein